MKFFSLGDPIERRTVAPAPSACSRASKTVLMARGLGETALRDGSSGGMTGSPTKVADGAIVEIVLFVLVLRCFDVVFKMLDRRKLRIYSARLSCW